MTLPSIGDVVDGKFRIERKLGEGGTSTIYEVRHAITEKQFAIKWLSPNLAKNDLAVQLLVHEAKVCGRFVHPNAVQIYDICRTADSYYLLMEFLEGESLETRLHREERMSPQAACDILLPCIEALGAAHRAGIVHRDLKPSNIYLCRIEGRAEVLPKVLDFGISNFLHNGIEISPHSAGSGTPLYMAPEQMQAQPADPRFDIYALGVVLYELVSGRPPFDSDDFDDLVHRVVESQPTRLDALVQVDSAFADIVSRAMARGVEDRFASMDDFAEALRPYSSHRSSTIVTPASPSQPPRPVHTRREEPSRPPGRRSSWAQTSQGFMFRQDMLAALGSDPASPAAPVLTPTAAAVLAVELEKPTPKAPAVVTAAAADPEATLEDIAVIGVVALDLEPEPVMPVAAPVASSAPKSQLLKEREPKAQKLVAAAKPQAKQTRDDTLVAPVAAGNPGSTTDAAPRPATPKPAAALQRVVTVPPIVLPPARGARVSLEDEIFWKDDAFGDDTPLRADDVFHGIPRVPRKRQIGLGLTAAFAGALVITMYTLARPADAPQAPAESLARTAAQAPDTAPQRVVEVTRAAAPVEVAAAPAESARPTRAATALAVAVAEPEPRVAPKRDAPPEPSAKLTDAAIARAARRAARVAANAAKRAAAASDNPKPKRLATNAQSDARAERTSSGDSARHGLTLPAAYVSRQDF